MATKVDCYVCDTEVALDDVAEERDGTVYDLCLDCQDAKVTWGDNSEEFAR